MRAIIGDIKLFIREVDKPTLLFCFCFISLLIIANFGFGFERMLVHHPSLYQSQYFGRVLVYATAYLIPWSFVFLRTGRDLFQKKGLLLCIVIAPFLFAIKVAIDTRFALSDQYSWNNYWNSIIYWPARALLLLAMLFVCWLMINHDKNKYGLTTGHVSYRPCFTMLLIMVPVITLAATQADFLHVYPKLKNVLPLPGDASPAWFYKVLYEAGYGTDFFSIELFFRGFLVIGLVRWAGKEAILPMACFYCSIHFGKPLGECISSFFGGTLLGIVSYHTRSIYGGLIVHLGIAWLMELAAVISLGLR